MQDFLTPSTFQQKTNSIASLPLITIYNPSLHILKCMIRESHYIFLSDPPTWNLLLHPSSIKFPTAFLTYVNSLSEPTTILDTPDLSFQESLLQNLPHTPQQLVFY